MKNVLIYLIGFPASGKSTTAEELSKIINAVIISNNMFNNLMLNVTDFYNAKIPDDLWEKNFSIRENTLAVFKEHHTESKCYTFTNELLDNDDYDQRVYKSVENFCNECGIKMFPVVLNCKIEELAKRMQSNHRIQNQKINSPEFEIKRIKGEKLLVPPGALEIDNSNLEPSETARIIIEGMKAINQNITLTSITKSIKREK